MVDKAREIALEILYKIDKDKAYSNILLNKKINEIRNKYKSKIENEIENRTENKNQNKTKGGAKNDAKNESKFNNVLDRKDINFISEIVYGVTNWRLTLHEIIKRHSKIKINKISTWILNILRLSIYQIVFLDKVPKSAAVNEGVNLAKKYGNKGSVGFTNAILRNIDKSDYNNLFNIEDEKERLSITNSMPLWIIEELEKEGLSKETILSICKSSNIRPKVSIRVNTLKTNKKELKEILSNENIKANNGILNDFLVLENVNNIEGLDSFKKGLFIVQDEGAGLIASILNPKPNERILDACSSPGGKTTYLAEMMKNEGKIEAWDIYLHRTRLVDENAKRLGINIIETNVENAEIYNEDYYEKFDKILLDVPCLGLGVLKRKPDIKWQKCRDDINEISKVQFNILNTCSKYLKVNGELVYSTCSILKEENVNIILKFLKNNKNFELKEINGEIKTAIKEKINREYILQYLKQDKFLELYTNEKTDGFFVCKLVKKGI